MGEVTVPIGELRRAGTCTVAQYLPRAVELCPPKSYDTYHAGYVRLSARYGGLALAEVRATDLELLRDQVHAEVGQHIVQRAINQGRRLRSYDPDAHGQGAAENTVRAIRHFFRCAVKDGLLASSPAAALAAPRRSRPPERALTAAELAEIYYVATQTGQDPVLDGLLLTFIRRTACRREGALNLTLGALDAKRRAVTVVEKFGLERELPLDLQLIGDLAELATSRGGAADHDKVFRLRSGNPITRRRFEMIFNRLDRHTTWSEPLDVGAHWLRHTTLSDVAAVSGLAVTRAYAGHQGDPKDTTLRYVTVTFEELEATYEALFGRHD